MKNENLPKEDSEDPRETLNNARKQVLEDEIIKKVEEVDPALYKELYEEVYKGSYNGDDTKMVRKIVTTYTTRLNNAYKAYKTAFNNYRDSNKTPELLKLKNAAKEHFNEISDKTLGLLKKITNRTETINKVIERINRFKVIVTELEQLINGVGPISTTDINNDEKSVIDSKLNEIENHIKEHITEQLRSVVENASSRRSQSPQPFPHSTSGVIKLPPISNDLLRKNILKAPKQTDEFLKRFKVKVEAADEVAKAKANEEAGTKFFEDIIENTKEAAKAVGEGGGGAAEEEEAREAAMKEAAAVKEAEAALNKAEAALNKEEEAMKEVAAARNAADAASNNYNGALLNFREADEVAKAKANEEAEEAAARKAAAQEAVLAAEARKAAAQEAAEAAAEAAIAKLKAAEAAEAAAEAAKAKLKAAEEAGAATKLQKFIRGRQVRQAAVKAKANEAGAALKAAEAAEEAEAKRAAAAKAKANEEAALKATREAALKATREAANAKAKEETDETTWNKPTKEIAEIAIAIVDTDIKDIERLINGETDYYIKMKQQAKKDKKKREEEEREKKKLEGEEREEKEREEKERKEREERERDKNILAIYATKIQELSKKDKFEYADVTFVLNHLRDQLNEHHPESNISQTFIQSTSIPQSPPNFNTLYHIEIPDSNLKKIFKKMVMFYSKELIKRIEELINSYNKTKNGASEKDVLDNLLPELIKQEREIKNYLLDDYLNNIKIGKTEDDTEYKKVVEKFNGAVEGYKKIAVNPVADQLVKVINQMASSEKKYNQGKIDILKEKKYNQGKIDILKEKKHIGDITKTELDKANKCIVETSKLDSDKYETISEFFKSECFGSSELKQELKRYLYIDYIGATNTDHVKGKGRLVTLFTEQLKKRINNLEKISDLFGELNKKLGKIIEVPEQINYQDVLKKISDLFGELNGKLGKTIQVPEQINAPINPEEISVEIDGANEIIQVSEQINGVVDSVRKIFLAKINQIFSISDDDMWRTMWEKTDKSVTQEQQSWKTNQVDYKNKVITEVIESLGDKIVPEKKCSYKVNEGKNSHSVVSRGGRRKEYNIREEFERSFKDATTLNGLIQKYGLGETSKSVIHKKFIGQTGAKCRHIHLLFLIIYEQCNTNYIMKCLNGIYSAAGTGTDTDTYTYNAIEGQTQTGYWETDKDRITFDGTTTPNGTDNIEVILKNNSYVYQLISKIVRLKNEYFDNKPETDNEPNNENFDVLFDFDQLKYKIEKFHEKNKLYKEIEEAHNNDDDYEQSAARFFCQEYGDTYKDYYAIKKIKELLKKNNEYSEEEKKKFKTAFNKTMYQQRNDKKSRLLSKD